VSLEKHWQDFRRTIGQCTTGHLKGVLFKRWVLDDVARDVLVASASISTCDYKEFYLSLIVSPGYEEQYGEFLAFAIQQIRQNTSSPIVYLDLFDFSRRAVDLAERLGFSRISTAAVLVKDYWIPIEDKGAKIHSPILLFSGKTTPATNFQSSQEL